MLNSTHASIRAGRSRWRPPAIRDFAWIARVWIAALCGMISTATVFGQQFDPFVASPNDPPRDRVVGEFVNLETQLIDPIVVFDEGGADRVVVANEPDGRLVVLDADLTTVVAEVFLGQGIASLAVHPSGEEIWVSVRHQMSVMVVSTNTWRITHLVRPPLGNLGATTADTPGGIAFDESGALAFVAATSTNTVQAYKVASKTHLASIDLSVSHNGVDTAQYQPMAIAELNDRIYVVSHLSGNQSIVWAEDSMGLPTLPSDDSTPIDDVVVRDLDGVSDLSLPDFDVVAIDPATLAVVPNETIRGVGTILFGIAATESDRLVVANMEAENKRFRGEGAFPDGKVMLNRLTIIDPQAPTDPHEYWSTDDVNGDPVAMPTDIAVLNDLIFVAGYCSSNIGVFDENGNVHGTIPTDAGPRGLAINASLDRLYCLNRADNTVTFFDSVSGSVPSGPDGTFALPDPTPPRIKNGRKIFLDADNSGAGTTNCASCHVDLRHDGIAWDLSLYFEEEEGKTFSDTPRWRDRKGVMVTQDLRSLEEVPPYHWRGDRSDLGGFNGAFVGLLKAPAELSASDFDDLQEYVFSTVYPPNPFQPMNRVPSSAGATGLAEFDNRSCNSCHRLPTGSDSDHNFTTPGLVPVPQTSHITHDMVPTQLRGQWSRTSPSAFISSTLPPPANPADLRHDEFARPITGFGFTHDGRHLDRLEFLEDEFGGNVAVIDDFLNELDSGLAPAAMYADYATSATIANVRWEYLVDQADNGHADLIAKGRIRAGGGWIDLGLYYDPVASEFVTDGHPQLSQNIDDEKLIRLIQIGDAEMLLLGVPVGSGRRLGIDRDGDDLPDGAELAHVPPTDPLDPDTDGDGLFDGYEQLPTDPSHSVPVVSGAPVVSNIDVVITNTNAAKITYETSLRSPTALRFRRQATTPWFWYGNPVPLAGSPDAWQRDHVAFVRPQAALPKLEAGATYEFEIDTEAQDGSTMSTALQTVTLEADASLNDARVGGVLISEIPGSSPSFRFYRAEVTMVNRLGETQPGITLRGVWSWESDATVPMQELQQTSTEETTDADGIATFLLGGASPGSAIVQQAGRRMTFDVPTSLMVGTNLEKAVQAAFTFGEGPLGSLYLVP